MTNVEKHDSVKSSKREAWTLYFFMPAGQPRKYKTPEEMEKAINLYFDEVEKNDNPKESDVEHQMLNEEEQ